MCHYFLDGRVVCDSVIFVTDDLKHDAGCVLTFINQLIEHLKVQLGSVDKLIIWSDGCSSQYKSKQPFANMAELFKQDVKKEWHYFGSRHGKNQSDGESGVVKTKMSRLLISQRVMVDSAKQFSSVAAEHLTVLDGDSLRYM